MISIKTNFQTLRNEWQYTHATHDSVNTLQHNHLSETTNHDYLAVTKMYLEEVNGQVVFG